MMPKLSDLPNKLAAATKQGAGGRGEASRIRRAVLAQLLGVLGHMYNYMYTYLLSKLVTLVTA